MGRPRRHFTWEFKVEAVRRVRDGGRPVSEVARELGIRPDLLHEWRRAVARRQPQAVGPPGTPSPEEEARRLRRELEVVKQERGFLRKAAAFFARGPR
jgi:transposase